jgi:hypothetical protein
LDSTYPEYQIPIIENLSLRRERFFQENTIPIIKISPLEVKTNENSMQILYLSTSMGSK